MPVKMQIRCRYSDPCLSFVKQITEEMHIKPIAEQDSELLARELTQRCIKVIRDRKEILPHKMGKKKIILTIAFLISLLPMLLNQYGGMKGVQEISGLINLLNPIGIISMLVFWAGVWASFENEKINKIREKASALSRCLKFIIQLTQLHVFLKTHQS